MGISVSRVGGAAQPKAMKKVAGTLKLTLAQYRSQAAFAMFASDLDEATRQQLTRGERLMELLKQPQSSPVKVEDQVAVIWAGTHGYLDDLPVSAVKDFEAGLIDHLHSHSQVLQTIADTGLLEDDTEASLKDAVEEFHSTFAANFESAHVDGADNKVEAEHTEEQITRGKRS